MRPVAHPSRRRFTGSQDEDRCPGPNEPTTGIQTSNIGSRSRGAKRPKFCTNAVPRERGRREDRVRAAPAVSRAICIKKCAHEHTGSAETLRPSLRNGFTAYFVLSPENGSFASVGTQGVNP